MKYIELFAGIGGFRNGLEQANNYLSRSQAFQQQDSTSSDRDNVGITQSGGGRLQAFSCCYANEWDKYAAQIYRRHYGEIDTRDIRDVPGNEIPEHDLLTAGFPCQDFSVAGKGVGLEGTRGTLFFEIARILSIKKPGHFLLENVKGLLSNQDGQTFITILGVLSDLGYRVEWMVLNSKHFGVPQNRERVFIIGHLRGECSGEVFPIRQSSGEGTESLGLHGSRQVAASLRATDYKGTHNNIREPMIAVAIQDGIAKERQVSTCLDANYYKGLDDHQARTGVVENARIRRLTPIECERLQGFPDGWTEGISDTQRYKCLGNAVTTTVITAIGEGLLEHLASQ